MAKTYPARSKPHKAIRRINDLHSITEFVSMLAKMRDDGGFIVFVEKEKIRPECLRSIVRSTVKAYRFHDNALILFKHWQAPTTRQVVEGDIEKINKEFGLNAFMGHFEDTDKWFDFLKEVGEDIQSDYVVALSTENDQMSWTAYDEKGMDTR